MFGSQFVLTGGAALYAVYYTREVLHPPPQKTGALPRYYITYSSRSVGPRGPPSLRVHNTNVQRTAISATTEDSEVVRMAIEPPYSETKQQNRTVHDTRNL